MKLFHIALFASLAVCNASAAWAQYGLYGSPEMLTVPERNAAQNNYVAQVAGYPTTAAQMVPPAPTQASYPSQPPYRYPVQQPTATAYQPYRPGARYRYPGPYYRPSMRMAAVAEQLTPIPLPPAVPADPSTVPAVPLPPTGEIPALQGSSPMNQTLVEQGRVNGCDSCGPYRGVLGRFEQAACEPYRDSRGYDGYCGQDRYRPWYASVSTLVLGRSKGRRFWTSYVTGDEMDQLANTQFGLQWKWGGEARFGRRFCCSGVPYAVEATYWTTEAFSGFRNITNPGGYVSTPLIVEQVLFNGVTANNWFQGAEGHRLWRRDEFHNVEINLVREQLAWAYDSPWDIGWSLGVRYFRFQDYLQFGSVAVGNQWGDLAAEAYLSDNITNNLVGVQFGFDAAYNTFHGVRLFITPKVGMYNNYLEHTFQARLGDGTNGSGVYGSFPVHSVRNSLAFLTQIDLGADWQFSRNWSARMGYRVVAVTGIGLADDQFPQYIVDKPEIADIQHYSSLVLHGAFFGLTYNF